MNIAPRLILASSSLYRQQLLQRLHLPFETSSPNINEAPLVNELPEQTALRLAREKAGAIALNLKNPDGLVIGSDQVATVNGLQIGKPGNHENALRQLQLLRGKSVTFHTALCLWDTRVAGAGIQLENVRTVVSFRNLPDRELDAYLHIEQPYDCAGSAKNEGLGIALIERIDSTDPTALTGLPLIALSTMLRRAGIHFFERH